MNAHHRRGEGGGVLAIMLFALVPVIALIGTLSSRQIQEYRAYEARIREQKASEKSLSALELGRSLIMNSTYNAGRNDRLHQASLQTGPSSLRPHPTQDGAFLGFNTTTGAYETIATATGLPAHIKAFRRVATLDLVDNETGEIDDINEKVSIYAAPVVGLWHVLEADARVDGVRRTARTFARERDPFSRFAYFVHDKGLNLGSIPDGPVHANRYIQFMGADKNYPAFVSAHEGFYYANGATPSNILFSGGSNPYAETIPMPSVADINALQNVATGAFGISNLYDRVRITFNDKRVTIVARRISNGSNVTLVNNQMLPANGVIYAAREITELSGDINGRVTVATPLSVDMTGSLRYVDSSGQTAYTAAGGALTYEPNPHYEGTSALGIIAGGDVRYAKTLPQNTVINAAIFTGRNIHLPGMTYDSNGNWNGDYDSSFIRSHLYFLGALIAKNSMVNQIFSSSSGTVRAGFQNRMPRYDWNLMNSPPPHFLAIDRPMFRGIEIVQDRAGSEVSP
jgi:hypothetical protein